MLKWLLCQSDLRCNGLCFSSLASVPVFMFSAYEFIWERLPPPLLPVPTMGTLNVIK